MEDDTDACRWWDGLPARRRRQIHHWVEGTPDIHGPIPGQIPLIDTENGQTA